MARKTKAAGKTTTTPKATAKPTATEPTATEPTATVAEPKADKPKPVPVNSFRNEFTTGPVTVAGITLGPLGTKGDTHKIKLDELNDAEFMQSLRRNAASGIVGLGPIDRSKAK